jgi:type 1 glutamine amidotransferase
MRSSSTYLTAAVIALISAACGEAQTAADLNAGSGDGTNGGGVPPGMQGSPPGDQSSQSQQPSDGQQPADNAVPNSNEMMGPIGIDPTPPGTGDNGSDMPQGTGGTAPMGDDMTEPVPAGPYAPREGSFKMLVYSRTTGYRHDSIAQGKTMLREIAAEQGFEITETEVNDLITPEGLAEFEIIFFMNSTGDIFNQTEEAAFQQWMETKNGAFAGTHSATDTEEGWAFYKEVTGQYYNGHVNANTPGAIQFEADMLQFPALVGIPNPWQRNEEWYNFNSFQEWSTKEGFKVLGRKQVDNQPIMWIREFGNWRSFYTAIGHDAAVFRDPAVKQHLTGGIMWAVRRDHLMQ